jgi:hypothetical protein
VDYLASLLSRHIARCAVPIAKLEYGVIADSGSWK